MRTKEICKSIGLWALVILLGMATSLIYPAIAIAIIVIISKFCRNELEI